MDAKHLSKRMQAVADLVPKSNNVADIGSDHAYLPAYLLEQGLIKHAIAGEVVDGPFKNAQSEIISQNLSHVMEARLGNGLAVIEPSDHVDTITIAGMGGELITDILERGKAKLTNHPVLVLQANVDENTLRKWLANHQYEITGEDIVYDAGHFYEMFRAEYVNHPVSYTREELDFGPLLLQNKTATFRDKWNEKLAKNRFILDKLVNSKSHPATKISKTKTMITEIEGVLDDNR
ncbi:tRNA (adenine(22)-N(1))-methyltransferase [Fructilactobacillus sp. Tb1]|uniref:tRNA (adenine(22)-N(1))-methyltransferase n=1 Tax=Fructilactobacillus sp. Tb1 TaxID=3422304 RepID=UPI003D2933E3